MASKISLLTSAASAYLGIPVELEDDAKNKRRQQSRTCNICSNIGCSLVGAVPLSPSSLFSYPWHHANDSDRYAVKLFGTDKVLTDINPNRSANDILRDISRVFGVTSHTLCFGDKRATGQTTLESLNVPKGRMCLAYWGDNKVHPTFYIDKSDLEPTKDFDFTNFKGEKVCERGGYVYERPIGWDRCALKVLDRYGDNVWLGEDGMRTDSTQGEWAVSYHGTNASYIHDIAHDGYDRDKAKRQLYGPGIYSTPTLKVAATYAIKFDHRGTKYKMILQNRVDLKKSRVIPAEKTSAGGPYFVTKDDHNIRPYGVLLKKEK